MICFELTTKVKGMKGESKCRTTFATLDTFAQVVERLRGDENTDFIFSLREKGFIMIGTKKPEAVQEYRLI